MKSSISCAGGLANSKNAKNKCPAINSWAISFCIESRFNDKNMLFLTVSPYVR